VLGRALVALVRPASVGAAYLVALSAIALGVTLSDDHVQGVSAPSVRALIATRFAGDVWDASLLALSTALLAGLTLGTLAGWLVALRDRLLGRAARSARELCRPAFFVVVAGHGLFWLYDVAEHPLVYAAALYARGGPQALLQRSVSDWLGPRGVIVLGAVTLLGYFGIPLLGVLRARRRSALGGVAGAAGLLVVGVLGVVSIRGLFAPRLAHAATRRPNVLVIAADSLRADRLGARVAPELSDLAERGVRFDRTYVSVPRTFPSWASILTGRDPHHHGVRNMFPRFEANERDLDAIPKRFASAGYRTAVVSDFAGDVFRRADFGFAHSRTPTFDMRELVREVVIGGQDPLLPLMGTRYATRALPVLRELSERTDPEMVTRDALDEIDEAGSRPFFVVAFYSTTHFPYAAPAPYWSRFLDRDYRGPYRYGKTPALSQERSPSDADIRAVRSLYDGAVSSVDDSVRALVRGLARRGLDKDTIVIVTADHGESLYEPGRGQGHGDHLFGDEAIRVPLVIIDPRATAARRIPDLVRSVDLAPTLCELAGVPAARDIDGRSLVPLMNGRALPELPAFAETGLWFTRNIPDVPPSLRLPYPDLTELLEVEAGHSGELAVRREFEPLTVTAKHRMVRDRRFKLIYVPTRQGVRTMLFDTERDPTELKDVAKDHPDIVARLSASLWHWMLEDSNMDRRGDFLLVRAGSQRGNKK
jgi:arylsulfatase A-like enzyme